MISRPVSSICLCSPLLCGIWHSAFHSLMLSSYLFFCLPCLLSSFAVPCKMVSARPDEWETCPYHCSLRLFTMVRRSSRGSIACWILARKWATHNQKCYKMFVNSFLILNAQSVAKVEAFLSFEKRRRRRVSCLCCM